jgi:citrate synthase
MEERYLSARRAAEELDVSLATLYAYVSRGMVRSETVEGKGRNRRYRAEDVRRLKERRERRRDPDRVVEGALHWGTPVLESGITLIDGDGLYYRGRDVVDLAEEKSIEEVAALIWTGDQAMAPTLFPAEMSGTSQHIRNVVDSVVGLTPVEVFQVMLPVAAAEDPAAYDLRPGGGGGKGGRVVRRRWPPENRSRGLPGRYSVAGVRTIQGLETFSTPRSSFVWTTSYLSRPSLPGVSPRPRLRLMPLF